MALLHLKPRAIFLVLAAVANAAAQSPNRDDAWRQDLNFLVSELTRIHPNPFFQTPRARFDQAVEELRASIPSRPDHQIAAGFARLLAMLGDGHTSLLLFQTTPLLRRAPVRFELLSDGLFVSAANEQGFAALGRKVTRIGDRTTEEALTALRPFISAENDAWPRFVAPNYLPYPQLLEAAGLQTATDSLKITVLDASGSPREFTFSGPDAGVFLPQLSRPLNPLYRRNPGQNYWFEYLPESKTFYMKYNVCRESPVLSMRRFTDDALAVAVAEQPERYVIDFRNNTGGDSSVIDPFLFGFGVAAEAGLLGMPREVWIVIGRQTASSASSNALLLKSAFPGAQFIGELGGGGSTGYGNILTILLPNSRLAFQVSSRGNFGDLTTKPDVQAENSSEQFFADRDAVMERILDPNRR